jgi:hypothetical protein
MIWLFDVFGFLYTFPLLASKRWRECLIGREYRESLTNNGKGGGIALNIGTQKESSSVVHPA